MPKRLAITIAGAVSLGSYEAGVLFEILEALRQHNEVCDQTQKPDEKIFVDVITGASAGGMTAVIAVQKLLYDEKALRDPTNNSFYKPWVAEVSLDDLFRFRPGESASSSLFSSDSVGEIADRHILGRYNGTKPPPVKHGAAADKIFLGLALSNVNGVNFRRSMLGAGDFDYSRYQDEWRDEFKAAEPADDTAERWKPLRNAALSCGAFPVAFRLVPLTRKDNDYQRFLNFFVPFGSADFAYTDGGTFQNEPLGLAKNFVDKIDRRNQTPSRFFLFVAPGARSATSTPDFKASASILQTLTHIAGAIFQQARFHDWIMAENINARIRRFDETAKGLKEDILLPPGDSSGRHVDWRVLQPAANALLPIVYRQDQEAMTEARNRLRIEYKKEVAEIEQGLGADGAAAAAVWIDALLTFERAAELDNRDEMKIYGITATNDELASDLLSSFGGFFDRRLREHDYLVGREKARAFLNSQATGNAGPEDIGPILYPNPPLIPQRTDLGKTTVAQLPKEQRVELRERLLARATESLKELKIPGIVITPVRIFFLRPMLNQPLGL